MPLCTEKKDTIWVATLAGCECLSIVLAHVTAVQLTIPSPLRQTAISYSPFCLTLLAAWLCAASHHGLWTFHRLTDVRTLSLAMGVAAGYSVICNVVLMYLLIPHTVTTDFLATATMASMGAIALVRTIWWVGIGCLNLNGLAQRRAVIVGANERTKHLIEQLKAKGYTVQGVLDDDAERAGNLGAPYLGRVSALEPVLAGWYTDELFIGLPVNSNYVTIENIIRVAEKKGSVVHVMVDLFQLRWAQNTPLYIADVPVLALTPVPENYISLKLKRLIDFIAASLMLISLAPAFLAVALFIKLDSRGPIFFSQERVGRNQRRFKMLKFRSMVSNAQDMRTDLEELNEASGPVFKIKADPRVTRFGAFMRKHSIDEFPQLINVWRGHMSLVGPRPPLPEEVQYYTWDQRRRLSVKPGMTGLWQVSGRNAIQFDDWVRLDLHYIDTWTLIQDFVILLKTFREVIQGRNAA